MLTQVKHQLKAHAYMDLYNTHPGLALPFPFIREPREGYCLANNCFILAVPPDNALIGLPQLSKISRPLPGETEMQGEQLPAAQRPCRRETGAGGPGHGQAGPPPGPTGPGLGATPPPPTSTRLRAAASHVARALPVGCLLSVFFYICF